MNVTELARILKISPNELREYLPQMGFDIGKKAIKVDNQTAHKIINQWPSFQRQLEAEKSKAESGNENEQSEEEIIKKEVKIPSFITVRNFSTLAEIPVNKILAELMKNGIFTSLNEKIDFETAAIIGADLNLEIKLDEKDKKDEQNNNDANSLKNILKATATDKLKERPPVIVVMGHVDHGKTKLLDAIRQTNVVDGEAGGITQHIGAYQVNRNDKLITFIDTPGHEAFTAMRKRGARIADIAILIVAADDGVKPQTVEAYRIIEETKIPFVVAINKVDKPDANIEKTKQELSTQLKITSEDWGGKIVCAPISAKTGDGISELLDMLLLTADMEEEKIKANPDDIATGTIIESHVNKGEGPVATVLVQNGTLRIGDSLSFTGMSYGKVRALKDYRGENVSEATPSTPVKIIGLKIAPEVGDILTVGQGEKMKARKVKSALTDAIIKPIEEKNDSIEKINLIIKSDVLGSGEAIEESLAKIDCPEVKINVVSKGLGNITEGDINNAESNNARIIGFNVKASPQAEEIARDKNIQIKLYSIIYELLNEIKAEIETMIKPEVRRVDIGKMKVLAIFKTEKNSQIVGGKITEGQIENNTSVEVIKDGQIAGQGTISKLQAGKQDVESVESGQECGIQFEGQPIIKEGDILQIHKEEKIKK